MPPAWPHDRLNCARQQTQTEREETCPTHAGGFEIAMKITRVSTVVYRQHIEGSGPKPKFAGEGRNSFETLLIKVETDAGIVGWGEAFPHRVWAGIRSFVETLIAPVCVGADPTDISALMNRLFKHTYGVGRAGPVMYALSGLDIALWDILGKAANLPIYKLLGGSPSTKVPAYASLLKYADTDIVVRTSQEALSRGYSELKVHETGRSEITAAAKLLRQHNGGSLMVDVNAPWNLQEALAAAAPLRELGLKWLEEPVWPPEDFRAAAEISEFGVPVAIGENVLSPTDFARLIETRAVDYIQPSVSKIGGISVMRDIYALANQASVSVAPHSAYFGPGLIATAHLAAALSRAPMVERLYCDLSDSPFGDWYEPKDGFLALPQGPGLGIEPDQKLLDKLKVD
jgi:L-alanine-DL-glutamate epimerase-like enolase superfamily enzyme